MIQNATLTKQTRPEVVEGYKINEWSGSILAGSLTNEDAWVYKSKTAMQREKFKPGGGGHAFKKRDRGVVDKRGKTMDTSLAVAWLTPGPVKVT